MTLNNWFQPTFGLENMITKKLALTASEIKSLAMGRGGRIATGRMAPISIPAWRAEKRSLYPFNAIWKQLMKDFVILVLVLSAPLGHAASFDCGRATQAVEKMICENTDLSRADDELGLSYDFLESRCSVLFEENDVRTTQRKWLASLRKISD